MIRFFDLVLIIFDKLVMLYYLKDFETFVFCLVELIYNTSPNNNQSSLYINNTCHLLNLKHFSFDCNEFCFEFDTKNLNNLHQILLYSPRAIDTNNEKILFIFYQLLKVYKYFHSVNINCSELKLSDIYIDKNLWIRIKPPIEAILNQYVQHPIEKSDLKNEEKEELHDYEHEKSILFYSLKQNLTTKYNSFKHLSFNDLADLTEDWCANK
jgi:hypothetical protein